MYMHSVDFGTIENFVGKIPQDGRYSGAGKLLQRNVTVHHSAAIT